jgi:glycosyltransferase involved in cell wall biosynthesis
VEQVSPSSNDVGDVQGPSQRGRIAHQPLSVPERERLARLSIARLSPSELLETWRLVVSTPDSSFAAGRVVAGSIAFQALNTLIVQSWIEQLTTADDFGTTQPSAWPGELREWVAAAFSMPEIGAAALDSDAGRPAVTPRSPSVDEVTSALFCFLCGRNATPDEQTRVRNRLSQGDDWSALIPAPADNADADPRSGGAEPSDLLLLSILCGSIVGRGIHPREGAGWLAALDKQNLDRPSVVEGLVRAGLDERLNLQGKDEGDSCTLMGSDVSVSVSDWESRIRLDCSNAPPVEPAGTRTRFHLVRKRARLVTAIASLYRGGAYIEHFLENITTQTIFTDACELIIVDAASPDGEATIIERYIARHPNIRLLRLDRRIGIYEAWNLAIAEARGEYLTNTNVDDVRRHDSLELQAATLEALPGIDVVYQDVLYALSPNVSYELASRVGLKSRLPLVGHTTLLSSNPPHNAPMWRRRLHDELGCFNTAYSSAADLEFWFRCVSAGKTFFKLDDPHVVYYHNPEGASTRSDSPGTREAREIGSAYAKVLLDLPEFANRKEFDRVFMGGVPTDEARYSDDRRAALKQRLRQVARRCKYPGKGTI